jgi:hypothetical protein
MVFAPFNVDSSRSVDTPLSGVVEIDGRSPVVLLAFRSSCRHGDDGRSTGVSGGALYQQSFRWADNLRMAINAAGTNALADSLVSNLANIRTLMGVTDQMGLIPLNSAPAAPTWPGTTSATKLPTPAELQAQVRAQNLANMQILFGMPSAGESNASLLPNIAGETARQIANVSIQSSRIALEFSTMATLFGYDAIGANTNTRA